MMEERGEQQVLQAVGSKLKATLALPVDSLTPEMKALLARLEKKEAKDKLALSPTNSPQAAEVGGLRPTGHLPLTTLMPTLRSARST